ncbi:DUF6879 family protein [Nocardia sp. XZ_19_369]|uniref:DUF6879 family protein n=1 Tax=Nocardia sp. XZ_19_369 TaxID=2769487 RepID=UPI0035A3D593
MEFLPTRQLFHECRNEAFRLEVRDSYGVPGESEPFDRFLNNEPFDLRSWFQDWYDFVQETTARGVTLRRVRVVTVPHTDYHRWLLKLAALNVEAGEDIRYIPRHSAGEVPSDDWWIFDNERVAFNLADGEGRAVGGAAATKDPWIVSYCRSAKDRLWPLATPFDEYAHTEADTG